MFTGLIECTGRVARSPCVVELSVPCLRLQLRCRRGEIRIGDSIAVNGACLTVIAMQGDRFSFDVSPETVARTTFAASQAGTPVNLERALRLGGVWMAIWLPDILIV